jgi:ferredoxin
MKVTVDSSRCEGFGHCANALPEVFLLDDDGYAYTEGDGAVPAGLEGKAVEAVHRCPVHAIAARED